MKIHKIKITPAVYQEQKPYNYRRITRLSRMSGRSPEEVEKILAQEYAKLAKQHQEKNQNNETRYINDATFDQELLSQLYDRVMTILGIPFDASLSSIHGFNLSRAEKYLLDIGYSKVYVENLKHSPTLTLIHYPQYLKPKYKKKFEVFFEKRLLSNKAQLEHPLVFYAQTLGQFITNIYNKGENPFATMILEAKTLPISALRSLYRYKFAVVLRYVRTFTGFSLHKFEQQQESFATNDMKITGFLSTGIISMTASEFKSALAKLKLGKKLAQGKRLAFHTIKGVDLIVYVEHELLFIKYKIRLTPQFRYYGIESPQQWIKKFVIQPLVQPSLSLTSRIKLSET